MSRSVKPGLSLLFMCLTCANVLAAPIHDAAAKGELARVESLLRKDSKLVSAPDKDGATPLHYAAASGSRAVTGFLLANKANVNARKRDGVTPLHVACALGRLKVADNLIAHGADVKASDEKGRTPLSLAEKLGDMALIELLRAATANIEAVPASVPPPGGQTSASQPPWIWAKGSLHTHTNVSGGNVSVSEVIRWYREHGYQFLVITDHSFVTKLPVTKTGGMLVIPGEELYTYAFHPGAIHMNAIGIHEKIPSVSEHRPGSGITGTQSVQADIDRIRAGGGIPMVNHPCFGTADPRDPAQQLLPVDRMYLMELQVSCGQRQVELTWDTLLSAGRRVYGTRTDDAHDYKVFDKHYAIPGIGWVVARVKSLTVSDVMAALDQGDFYASTGVELDDVQFKGRQLRVSVRDKQGLSYAIQFIGKDGRVLMEANGVTAGYVLPVDQDGYVRAKITSSDGKAAWTQAFWPKDIQ